LKHTSLDNRGDEQPLHAGLMRGECHMRQIVTIAKHEPDEWSDAWHLRQLAQPLAAVRCTRRSTYYSLTCEAPSPMVSQLAPSGRAGCRSFRTWLLPHLPGWIACLHLFSITTRPRTKAHSHAQWLRYQLDPSRAKVRALCMRRTKRQISSAWATGLGWTWRHLCWYSRQIFCGDVCVLSMQNGYWADLSADAAVHLESTANRRRISLLRYLSSTTCRPTSPRGHHSQQIFL